MSEKLGNNTDIEKEKSINEIEEHKNIIDNGVNKFKENSKKQKERSIEERIEETFGNLDGQKFERGDVIEFLYMSEDGKKNECSFNIKNQTIEYKGIIYKIEMPKGANLNSIEFRNGEINVVGSILWVSKEGKTSNTRLYNALGKVFNNGYIKIATGDGESLKIIKELVI